MALMLCVCICVVGSGEGVMVIKSCRSPWPHQLLLLLMVARWCCESVAGDNAVLPSSLPALTDNEHGNCQHRRVVIGAATLCDPWDASLPTLWRSWGPTVFGPLQFLQLAIVFAVHCGRLTVLPRPPSRI